MDPTIDTDAALALYQRRWERSWSLSDADADRLQARVAAHMALETHFPNPQQVLSDYVRRHTADGPEGKFRIRTYTHSPMAPSFIEVKETSVDEDGRAIRTKRRATVGLDTTRRLAAGEPAAQVIGTDGRSGEDLEVAQAAIHIVDELGMRPVVRNQYRRTAWEDAAAGVRVTFDRHIDFTGIGELAAAGAGTRGHAILDVKVTGDTPGWLADMLDAETTAGVLELLRIGKGGTAVRRLAGADW